MRSAGLAGTHEKITTGRKENKFGIDIDLAREAYAFAGKLPNLQVVGVATRERSARLLQQLEQVPIADEDAREVRQAVPAQVERPDVQRDRRQAEVRERNEAAVIDGGLQWLPQWIVSAS